MAKIVGRREEKHSIGCDDTGLVEWFRESNSKTSTTLFVSQLPNFVHVFTIWRLDLLYQSCGARKVNILPTVRGEDLEKGFFRESRENDNML